MVKTTGPLFSLEAHGKLANTLNYSKKRSGSQVRKFHYPKKKVTGPQWTQRHIIGMITARWQVMTDEEKAPYLVDAKIANPVITGFNYFVYVAQTDMRTHLGLMGCWLFNETGGAAIIDASGGGSHGTLEPTYPSDVPARIPSFSDQYHNALRFNDTARWVGLGSPAALKVGTSDFTLVMWVKTSTTDAGEKMLYVSRGATKTIYTEIYQKKARIVSGSASFQHSQVITDGKWHFLCFACDRDAGINISVDLKAESNEATDTASFDPNEDVVIGVYGATQDSRWEGDIDNVMLFDRVLSAAEQKKIYEIMRRGKKRQPRVIH